MAAPTTTFGWLERAREGDPEAFRLLFERYRRRLAVLIHYRLGPELRAQVEVDDLLQETLLRAFRDLSSFTYRDPGSFFGWLAAIAGRAIADAARYYSREKRAAEVVPLRADPVDRRTPSRILAEDENLRALIARLDALPPDYREVILLARIERLPTAEVAVRMGKSRENVAVLLHRALKRFRGQ